MENENIEPKQEQTEVNRKDEAVDALIDLKKNSVPKTEYDELNARYKKVLDSVVNGGTVEVVNGEDQGHPIDELRKDLLNPECNLSNLEYAKKALELRKKVMDEGKVDPFIPVGRQISATDNDIALANKVATVIEECIEIADGDSAIFTNELQRRTMDTVSFPRR